MNEMGGPKTSASDRRHPAGDQMPKSWRGTVGSRHRRHLDWLLVGARRQGVELAALGCWQEVFLMVAESGPPGSARGLIR